MISRVRRIVGAMVALGAISSCGTGEPRALALNEDQCGYCRMEITDARFGAQVATSTGKVQVFDSVECLAGYLRGADTPELRGAWVADAERPEHWVPVADAGYLVGSDLRGPMGHVVAFASPEAARAASARFGGTTAGWEAIRSDSAGIVAHAGH